MNDLLIRSDFSCNSSEFSKFNDDSDLFIHIFMNYNSVHLVGVWEEEHTVSKVTAISILSLSFSLFHLFRVLF